MDKSIIKWTPPKKSHIMKYPLPSNQKYQQNKQNNNNKKQQKTTDM